MPPGLSWRPPTHTEKRELKNDNIVLFTPLQDHYSADSVFFLVTFFYFSELDIDMS